MSRRTTVFKVPAELRTQQRPRNFGTTDRQTARDPGTASPFDTPSSVVVMLDNKNLTFDFKYDLSGNEPLNDPESVGGGRVFLGKLSGRVMRIELSGAALHEGFAGFASVIADALEKRLQKLPTEPGTPLRRAAHYELVGLRVLPDLDAFCAEQLPELRRQTAH